MNALALKNPSYSEVPTRQKVVGSGVSWDYTDQKRKNPLFYDLFQFVEKFFSKQDSKQDSNLSSTIESFFIPNVGEEKITTTTSVWMGAICLPKKLEYRNPVDIENFLEKHSNLKLKLPEAMNNIITLFPEINLALEAIKDSEGSMERVDLVLYIVTTLKPNEAMSQLSQIDEILLRDGLMADPNFNSNLEYLEQ